MATPPPPQQPTTSPTIATNDPTYILSTKRCKLRQMEHNENDHQFLIKLWNDPTVINGPY